MSYHRCASAGVLGGDETVDDNASPTTAATPPRPTASTTAAADDALAAAAAADDGAVHPARATARLVDVAMLASLGGLAFALGAVLRLQAYLAYILPLPVAVAAGRWGPTSGVRAACATALLALGESPWCFCG